MPEPTSSVTIRSVRSADLPAIAAFIEPFVAIGKLLPRTTQELEDLLPHGFVAESDGRIVGFAALEIYSPKMSEIRSLAVASDFRGAGIGKRLVQRCVERACERNVLEIMAITSNEEFFKQCGFDFTLPGREEGAVHSDARPVSWFAIANSREHSQPQVLFLRIHAKSEAG